MTSNVVDQLIKAIKSKDPHRHYDALRALHALHKQPSALPEAQEAVAQLLASYEARGQGSLLVSAFAMLDNFPAVLEKIHPETLAGVMAVQLRSSAYNVFGRTLQRLQRFKDNPAFLAEHVPETLARQIKTFLEHDLTTDVAKTLGQLEIHKPLFFRVEEAAARHGVFLRPASQIPLDQNRRSYFLALTVGDDAVKVSSGCHTNEDLANILYYWASSDRKVTPDRRAYVIPAVMDLLDAAATSPLVPDAVRFTAQRAYRASSARLARYGINHKPTRSGGSMRGAAGAETRGLGLGGDR